MGAITMTLVSGENATLDAEFVRVAEGDPTDSNRVTINASGIVIVDADNGQQLEINGLRLLVTNGLGQARVQLNSSVGELRLSDGTTDYNIRGRIQTVVIAGTVTRAIEVNDNGVTRYIPLLNSIT
jgi:hypothetical protein